MRQLVSILAVLALLSSCGIKRPLELPGKEKHHKPEQATEHTDAVPAPVSQPGIPSVETNPSVLPSPSDADKMQPGQEPVQLQPPAE